MTGGTVVLPARDEKMRSPAQKLVAILAACQALLLTNNITLVAVTALAGASLATDKSLATLPITTYILGSALFTLPASLLMQRFGRRLGFTFGGLFALAGALLATYAVWATSFIMLCCGTFLTGVYSAFGGYYRFAAADAADATDPGFKARAISLVLAGGIVGGVIGPETSKITRDLFPAAMFSGSYAMLAVFAIASLVLIQMLKLPMPTQEEMHGPARPLTEIMRQPAFIVSALCAMLGYGVMSFLMIATPLTMQVCAYPYNDIAFILEWHVIGMFLPSFFTGGWIKRFGVLPVMGTGAGLMLLCTAIAMAGVQLTQFWFALVLLGVGWNFLFVGSTTLLTTTYTPAEKAKTQGMNDFLISGAMLLAAFLSGVLGSSNGWADLNMMAIPFIVLMATAVLTLAMKRGWKMA